MRIEIDCFWILSDRLCTIFPVLTVLTSAWCVTVTTWMDPTELTSDNLAVDTGKSNKWCIDFIRSFWRSKLFYIIAVGIIYWGNCLFQWNIYFISSAEPKSGILGSGEATSENTTFCVHKMKQNLLFHWNRQIFFLFYTLFVI